MKRISLTLLLLQCIVLLTVAQFTIQGTVENSSGELLPSANIAVVNSFAGAISDSNGFYRINNLKPGNYSISVSFVGYETVLKDVVLNSSQTIDFTLSPNNIMAEEVLIAANLIKEKTPVAYTTINKSQIIERNLGQDIPYILSLSPSFVATSDAGTGIGYTNFRIRGTDMNRINVTINGFPMNDAESHGTWWVDIPDLAASANNIQIQRGVGTSTNGAAAFGASINLQTSTVNRDAFAQYSATAGSFGTLKNSVSVGSGLLNNKFTFDARLSKITSDGFIDRASADLKSFYVSGAFITDRTIIKLNVFSGLEHTYQAWNGVPSVRLNNDLSGMQRYADHWLYSQKKTDEMINSNSRTYNLYTYENEVDHYQQDYHQLLFSHTLNKFTSINAGLFYTRGNGYYEQFKENKKLVDYLIPNIVIGNQTIKRSDIIQRKWLDNDYYGTTFTVNHKKDTKDITVGGGYNIYDGLHFGKVIWMANAGNSKINHEWYRSSGNKKDFNFFVKYNYVITDKLNLFADLQYRAINYEIAGTDDDLRDISQIHKFEFFNPKAGLFYEIDGNQKVYLNFARANREPNRSNYVDADPTKKLPVYETLNDFELGYKLNSQNASLSVNAYYMMYQNQLILTGEINDVGAAIMTNTDESYRAGLEISSVIKITEKLKWDLNITVSKNKINDYAEFVDDWDNGGQIEYKLGTTDLAFSPWLITNSQFSLIAAKNLKIDLQTFSVSKQYIDNSSSDNRKLDGYLVNNLKFNYNLKNKLSKSVNLHLMVNNIFDVEYENNAWVYSYITGGERFSMDGYFPQAGINFLAGIDISF